MKKMSTYGNSKQRVQKLDFVLYACNEVQVFDRMFLLYQRPQKSLIKLSK